MISGVFYDSFGGFLFCIDSFSPSFLLYRTDTPICPPKKEEMFSVFSEPLSLELFLFFFSYPDISLQCVGSYRRFLFLFLLTSCLLFSFPRRRGGQMREIYFSQIKTISIYETKKLIPPFCKDGPFLFSSFLLLFILSEREESKGRNRKGGREWKEKLAHLGCFS